MLATLVDKPPVGDWRYEIKWDGYRAIAYLDAGSVEIRSRNNKVFTGKYYPIAKALSAWKARVIVDGELVVLDDQGRPDFGALQNWRSETDGPLIYYLFDLLWIDGRDVMGLPFTVRRTLLRKAMRRLPEQGPLRLSEDFAVTGGEIFEQAKALDLEGVVAKRADAPYVPGIRSRDWLKVKTEKQQEAVIGGYTLNEGSSKLFSALLVGVYRGNAFHFLSPVGTGFSDRLQRELMKKLAPLRIKQCPFMEVPDYNKPSRFRPDPPKATATWVKPELVVELRYRELTRDGAVRHPAFKGLRADKRASEVHMELPQATRGAGRRPATPRARMSGKLVRPPKQVGGSLLNPTEATQTKTVNGHTLTFSNLNKVFWPGEGITKRDMLNYYHAMAPVMLPYYRGKPQTLNRYPNGIQGKAFYQKNVKGKVPEWVETHPYFSETDREEKEFLVVSNEASILHMASLGCIEMHPWNSRSAAPDDPDWCVIDLDPERTTFAQVIECAQVTHRILDALGVANHAKTSGSTGLHIYIPLGAKYSYEASKEFARIVATLVHAELPRTTSIERRIADRQHRMYIDFLQNRPQATVAGPYSLRPKPGAPVSMPLEWSEVKKGLRITDHHIGNAAARVKETGDLFKPVLGRGVDLKKALKSAERIFGVNVSAAQAAL